MKFLIEKDISENKNLISKIKYNLESLGYMVITPKSSYKDQIEIIASDTGEEPTPQNNSHTSGIHIQITNNFIYFVYINVEDKGMYKGLDLVKAVLKDVPTTYKICVKGDQSKGFWTHIAEKYFSQYDWTNLYNQNDKSLLLKYLYHATYKPFLNSIKKNGLGNTNRKMYSDSKGKGVVYLADDKDIAISYAEASEWVEDQEDPDKYLDNIIVLKIDVSKLNQNKLFSDENVRNIEDDATYEYHGIIPFDAVVDIIEDK